MDGAFRPLKRQSRRLATCVERLRSLGRPHVRHGFACVLKDYRLSETPRGAPQSTIALTCQLHPQILSPLVFEGESLDMRRIASAMSCALHSNDDRSAYKNIRVVRPFETVVLSAAGRTSKQQAPPTIERFPAISTEALATELRRRICRAVDRAIGNRRVGIMLSGGFDSSTVLAALFAVRGVSTSVVPVTLDFDAPGSDRPHIRALEEHFGISVIRLEPQEVSFEQALILDAAPSRHHGDMWVMACAERAHAGGAEILLTGDGGDRFFGGTMGPAVREGVYEGDFAGAWDAFPARRFPFRPSVSQRFEVVARALAHHFQPGPVRRARFRRKQRTLPNWAGPLLRTELTQVAYDQSHREGARTAQQRFDEASTSSFECEYTALARAQTDHASPIPRVDPLYDEELIRFLLAVSQHKLFADATYRGLARRAMRGLLPDAVRNRIDKSDFEPAFASAISFDDLRPLLSFECLGRVGIVEVERFRQRFAPLYASPREPRLGSLWAAIIPAVAAEAFLRTQ